MRKRSSRPTAGRGVSTALVGTAIAVLALAHGSPAQAYAATNFTVQRVGSTVTIDVDCSSVPIPVSASDIIEIYPGDTVVFTSTVASGTGTCNKVFHLDGATPVSTFAPYFSSMPPSGVVSGPQTLISKSDATLDTPTDRFVFYGNVSGIDNGVKLKFIFRTPPPPVVTADATPIAGGSATATDGDSDGTWDLQATANSGYVFTSWSCTASEVPASTTDAATTITPTADTTCTATFDVDDDSGESPPLTTDWGSNAEPPSGRPVPLPATGGSTGGIALGFGLLASGAATHLAARRRRAL